MVDSVTAPAAPDVKITPVGEHTTPSNTHERALPTGGIPAKPGQVVHEDTDTIPAVPDTTLTQVNHPEHVRAMQNNPKPEPFGRQMNATIEGQIPSDIELDPQVFPRAKVPGTQGSTARNTVAETRAADARALSNASVAGKSAQPQGAAPGITGTPGTVTAAPQPAPKP